MTSIPLRACAAFLAAFAAPSLHGAVLDNGVIRLQYHQDTSLGLVLDSLGDAATPTAHNFRAADLWQLDLLPSSGCTPSSTNPIPIRPGDPGVVFTFGMTSTATSVQAIWSNLQHPAASDTFTVTVDVVLPTGANDAEMTITVVNTAGSPVEALFDVEFPRLEIRSPAPAGDQDEEVLTVPHYGGWLLRDPLHNPLLGPWPNLPDPPRHPGILSMQWFAYYWDRSASPSQVLTLGSRDDLGWQKGFRAGTFSESGSVAGLTFSIERPPQDNLCAGNGYTSSFPCTVGHVVGDWYDAARDYREWAVTQPFAGQPMRNNPDFSPLVKDADAYATTAAPCCTNAFCQGDSCELQSCETCNAQNFVYWARDLADQKAFLNAGEIPTLLYQWDKHPLDAHIGDPFPMQSDFLTNVPAVVTQGDAFAPYFNPRQVSQGVALSPCLASYTNAEAVVDVSGNPIIEAQLDKCGNNMSRFCYASPFFHQYLQCSVSKIRDDIRAVAPGLTGLGVYLDTYNAFTADTCYAPAAQHQHPLGGGSYYHQNALQALRDLRTAMRTNMTHPLPDFFVYSEGESEMFLGDVELTLGHLTDFQNNGETKGWLRLAPLFRTVYHDYLVGTWFLPMGQPACVLGAINYTGVRRQIAARLFMGYELPAGSHLDAASLAQNQATFPAYLATTEMVRDYLAVLKQTPVRDHVRFGWRTRDPLTVVAHEDGSAGPYRPYTSEQPVVYVTARQNPDRPGFGFLLMNWTDAQDTLTQPGGGPFSGGDTTVSVWFRLAWYDQSPGTYRITVYSESGPPLVTTKSITGPSLHVFSVPARSARFAHFERIGP